MIYAPATGHGNTVIQNKLVKKERNIWLNLWGVYFRKY